MSSVVNRSLIFLLAAPVILIGSANATTIITNTQITDTNIQQYGNDDSLTRQYNKEPVDDATLGRLIEQETMKLNSVMRSSVMTIVANTKNGQPDMIVIASDETNSQPLTEVISADAELEAENRKREMEEIAQLERFKNGEITHEELEQQILRSVFPVRTTLKPTQLPSRRIEIDRRISQAIHEPLAVIGADQYSLSWFKANADLLKKLRAGIIVTQVENPVDLEAIRTIAPELQYQPLDASTFLSSIGVSVYPILITAEGALQ